MRHRLSGSLPVHKFVINSPFDKLSRWLPEGANKMSFIRNGYLARRSGRKESVRGKHKGGYRDWFLIKYSSTNSATLKISDISLPHEYIGKKVRFKIEIIK